MKKNAIIRRKITSNFGNQTPTFVVWSIRNSRLTSIVALAITWIASSASAQTYTDIHDFGLKVNSPSGIPQPTAQGR